MRSMVTDDSYVFQLPALINAPGRYSAM